MTNRQVGEVTEVKVDFDRVGRCDVGCKNTDDVAQFKKRCVVVTAAWYVNLFKITSTEMLL